AELSQWIRTEAPNIHADSLNLLGTVPHPAGPGIVQTFIQLGNREQAPVLRLIWERNKVGAFAGGIRFPGFGRFRMTSNNTAVAYHPTEPGIRTIEVQRDSSGNATGIVIVRESGNRTGTLRRIP
ncbi:MAG TPA: hypothetical protein VM939_04325, partial [Gemmatimonadaceae bacterium]|nr:hypothetical protein [Gemmatimonadaceae bacterium]